MIIAQTSDENTSHQKTLDYCKFEATPSGKLNFDKVPDQVLKAHQEKYSAQAISI